jgi:hypothetical protein
MSLAVMDNFIARLADYDSDSIFRSRLHFQAQNTLSY